MQFTAAAKAKFQDGLLDLENEEAFFSQYGTNFLKRIVFGGELYIKYTVSSVNVIDQLEVDAKIGVGVGVGVGGGEVGIGLSAEFFEKYSTDQFQLTAEIKSSSLKVIDIGLKPKIGDIEEVVKQWTEGYMNLTRNIKDVDVPSTLSIVGFVLQDLAKELKSPPAIDIARLQQMMQNIAPDMMKTLFEWQHLKVQDEKFSTQWGGSRSDLANLYEPWKGAAQSYMDMLFDKLGAYYDYRGASIVDIVSGTVSPPKAIDTSTWLMIKGVNGVGYVPTFIYNDVTYERLYYEGFTLPSEDDNSTQMAFYNGKLHCNLPNSLKGMVIGGPDKLLNLAAEIATYPPNYCITDFPSASPSSSASPSASPSPSLSASPSASPSKQYGCNSPPSR